MEARGANNFDNHNAIYEMKKAALGAALNWPAGQIPIVGGTIQDVTIRGMIGVEPTPESVAANAPTVTVADAMNQTNFDIAEDLVRNDANLGEMSKYVHADGTLMKPEEIDANLQRDYLPGVPERRRDQYSERVHTRIMTRLLALMCVLLTALSTAAACGTSPPSLPPDSPSEVFTRLTSDSADDFLNDVTTFAWEDDGGAAGALFTWIGRDAASTDRDAASQAERSAAIIANFLLTQHNDLMSVGSGFLGLTKVPAAQLNPLLIRSYASAVAPYVDQFVSGDDEAFGSLRSKVAEDPATLRNLLAILVSDPDAGRTMAQAADTAAAGFEDDAVAAPPDSDTAVADLTAAGSLLGSVEGAVTHVGAADVSTPTIGEALNDLSVRIATTLVRNDPNPATLSRYVRNGQLMAPADVEREFTQDDMRNYFLSLRSYLSEKGFGDSLDAFQDGFRAGSGEASP